MIRTSTLKGFSLAAAGAAVCFLAAGAFSQPTSRSPLAPPPNGPRKSEPGDGYIALTNATVHVKPGETIEKATVVMRGGRIESVAAAAADSKTVVPPGAEERDCTGMHIYAGFLDPYFEVEVPKPDPNAPGSHWNARVTPQRTALDKGASGIPAKDAEALRSMGFVAAAISPKGGIFRGSSAMVSLAQTSGDPSEAMPRVYADHVYQSVSLSTRDQTEDGPPVRGGPRQSEEGRWNSYPTSQMGAIALVRQTLSDADWQQHQRASVVGSGALDALRGYGVAAPGTGVGIPHEVGMLLFDAEDELEVLREAKIAKEFSRDAAILGSGLEFRRLEAIASAKLPIILPLNYPKAPKVGSIGEADAVELKELINWEQAPTNARRLDAAGLTIALTTSKVPEKLGGRKSFRDHLGTAIKHGLKPDRALAMLTTNAATVLGVESDFGTIEKGKVASLILADGDLFTDKPDAPKKGEPGYVRAGRVIDVFIDGRRHVIAAKQRRDLGGTWDVTLTPGPKAGSNVKITFEIDDDFPPAITIVKRSTESEPSGASRRSDPPAPPDAPATPDTTPKEKRATTKAQGVSIEEDGRLKFTFDHEPFGEKGVFVSSGVIEKGDDGQPIMRGESIRSGGQLLRWSAVRVSTEIPKPDRKRNQSRAAQAAGGDPAAAKEPDAAPQPKDFENMGIPPEFHKAIKDYFEKLKKEKGAESQPQQPPSEPPAKPGETTSEKDSAGTKPTPQPQPADTKPDTTAKSDEPKKSKTPEADALAAIPEKLGLPLGAYAAAALPAQERILLRHATIWTSAEGGVLEDASVMIDEGKLGFIGTEQQWADLLTRARMKPFREIDCTGKHITPGIIDCHSHTGISKGVNEGGQAVTAEVRIGDVTDPDSISWYRQLASGVTTVNSLHGSANPIGGQNQVNKNRWGCASPDDMHFAGAIPGIKFALGENVKQSNGDRQSSRYPVSRMGVETLMRDRFAAAREYAAAKNAHSAHMNEWAKAHPDLARGLADKGSAAKEQDAAAPRRDLELEALAEILEGTRLIHCHSYRQDEILMLCRIADEFGFKIGTFQHGLEVYKVADIVKDHVVPGGGASIFADWWAYKVEVQDAIPYAGPLQTEIGVLTSYNSDSDEMARRLNVEAGKAVKYSHGKLTDADALKFVTINPAKQLKIDEKVGSLESGKDADLAIWSGPPLSSMSRCERTFVDGREMFSLEKDAELRKSNQAERARIIQKILAQKSGPGGASDGPGGRGKRGGDTEDSPTPDGGKPTSDEYASDETSTTTSARHSLLLNAYRAAEDARREYFLDLLRRGLDPRFHAAGECGCAGN